MTDWATDVMGAYASTRGLAFEPSGPVLPTATPLLAEGLGLGEHRAQIVTHETDNSFSAVGGFTKRPERETTNICRGTLPGGLDGQICHHVRLVKGYRDEDTAYTAVPVTVAFAMLPSGSRGFVDFSGNEAGPPIKALGSVDLSEGDAIVPHPIAWAEAGGWRFRAEPAEDDRVVQSMAAHLAPFLDGLPERTRIQLRDGALCVSARGTISDPAVLDRLCHLASAVADAVARVVAMYEPLDPTAPLPAPRDTPRSRWIDQGVRQIDWPTPPASVPAAVAAYSDLVRAQAKRSGARVGRIAFVVSAIVAGLLVLIDVAAFALADEPPIILWIATGFGVLIALPGVFGATRVARRDVIASHIGLRAGPWGIEAFARGYANASRMRLEDVDEFRHRFDSPIPGRPLKVLRASDDLRLVIWLSRYELPKQHWLLAIAPDGEVTAQQVTDEGRSADALDALARAARQTASKS